MLGRLAPSLIALIALAVSSQQDSSVSIRVTCARGPLDVRAIVRIYADADSKRPLKELVVGPSPNHAELTLPDGDYVLSTEAPGLWGPSQKFRVGENQARVLNVTLWPTSDVLFDVKTSSSELVKDLVVQFRGTPASGSAPIPGGVLRCAVVKQRAPCALPEGTLDIRITGVGGPSSPPFMPDYFWDINTRLRNAALSVVPTMGSTLVGYVRTTKDEPARGIRVKLASPTGDPIPANTTTVGDRKRPDPPLDLGVSTNERGFFQIRQITPASYRVVAVGENGTSGQASVVIDPNRETALRDFLVLEKPYQISLSIEPPLSPSGSPWAVSLLRTRPSQDEVRYTAASDGTVLVDAGRGHYNLAVVADGAKYFTDSFDVDEQPGPIRIELTLVKVKGSVTIGGKPLRAEVIFGGARAARSIPLVADDTGEFSGTLPNAGDWIVEVNASDANVHRRLRKVSVVKQPSGIAEVNINLSDGRLRGRVVGNDDRAIARALINLSPFDSPEDSSWQVTTDDTGGFFLAGLSAGVLTVHAVAPTGDQSAPIEVAVKADEESAVTLIVTDPDRLVGHVVSSVVQPVPAASVVVLRGAGRPLGIARSTGTDPEGRFELKLPPKMGSASVAYWANGYSLELVNVAVGRSADEILVATTDGGTLAVTLPGPTPTDGPLAVVVHNGVAIPALGLATVRRGGPMLTLEGSTPHLTIANLAPGDYSLCGMEMKALQRGLSPTVDPRVCSSGQLLPGGMLTLSLPSTVARADK